MTRRRAAYLYAFAAWTVFVWVVFIRNVARDHTHTTGFKVVHITLAVISLAFAAGCVWVVSRARREPLSPEDRATSATASVPPRR